MIGFYQDAALQNPVLAAKPKRFLLPHLGGTKPGSIFIGDPYTATLTAPTAIAATTIALDQTAEFPAAGSAVVYIPATGSAPTPLVINYTTKTTQSLTGVTGITSALGQGYKVRPNITWRSRGNVVFIASGSDIGNVNVAFGLPGSLTASPRATRFGVGGAPYIAAFQSIAAGVENVVRLDLAVTVPTGADTEFQNWNVSVGTLYSYQFGNVTAIPAAAYGTVPVAPGYVNRRDQGAALSARLLPANREVTATVPGFVLGTYRWRDRSTIDAVAIVPTKWDADNNAIGIDKFTTGIGDSAALAPVGLVEGTGTEMNSVFMQIMDGSYFDGPVRYFLSGTPGLEFQSGLDLVHILGNTPASLKPVFVGTWKLDSDGFYSVDTAYRYQAGPFVNDGTPQFQLSRATRTVTLNQPMAATLMFLGVLSGTGSDTFNLPVYPVYSIQNMYIALGAGLGTAPLNQFNFNSDLGTVQVTSTPGGIYAAGQPVYAVCNPAAFQYEVAPANSSSSTNTRQLPVDLNPAFSGITSGYIYLQHRQLAPSSITLSCDKPLIAIPRTLQSIIGLVAYGPVYFTGDYALLSATAYGPLNGEVVPNVTMNVVVDPSTWSGLINYKDPTVEDVTVTTGADGVVNMIYTPEADWGLYIPAAAAAGGLAGIKQTLQAGDTVVLPEPLPISEIWDGNNWLVTLYTVANDNPIYGTVGANITKGQVPWITSGTPGTPGYKTNGELDAWLGKNTAQVAGSVIVGANTITLTQTGNFPASGTSIVGGMIINYTGKTATELTGVTGVTAAIANGALIYPPYSGQGPIVPIQALDAAGHNYLDANGNPNSLFSGEVVSLVYAQPIPTFPSTAAYFLTFLQRVQIHLVVEGTNLTSNTILVQMADPPLIVENPWLILGDAVQGYLGQYRLGQSNAGSISGPN